MAEPELLLLDEPAAGLDLAARERLVRRLAALVADPRTPPMMLVTHHTEEIPPGMSHVALMSGSRIVRAGLVGDVLTGEALSECFGVHVEVDTGGWTLVCSLDGLIVVTDLIVAPVDILNR